MKPQAVEYNLALVREPNDVSYVLWWLAACVPIFHCIKVMIERHGLGNCLFNLNLLNF